MGEIRSREWCCAQCQEGCLLPCEYCNKQPGVGCGKNQVGQFACIFRQQALLALSELQRIVLKAVYRV